MSRATIKQLLTGGASLMQRSASSAGSQPNAVGTEPPDGLWGAPVRVRR